MIKIGIFCFYSATHCFNESRISVIAVCLCLMGIVDSSIKMWGQDDLKKIVATATVLDMNFTYILFLFNDSGFL